MNKEYILCAAVKYNDDIIAGYRHGDCYKILRMFVPDNMLPGREYQGFLTSKNRFVDRGEALRIARDNEQIWHNNKIHDILTSEDLYWYSDVEEKRIEEIF